MKSSRIVGSGSLSVLLEYIRSGPGMPSFIRHAWELRRLLSFGRDRCGSKVDGMYLVVCCMGYWMLGCVFQCWMLAFMSRVLLVIVRVGSCANLFSIVDLRARFWHIRVSL